MVSPIDALMVINDLNTFGTRRLSQANTTPPPPFIDVNGDGSVSSIDALQIINILNASGDSEPEPRDAEPLFVVESPQSQSVPLREREPLIVENAESSPINSAFDHESATGLGAETVVQGTLRAVPATVPAPFWNHAESSQLAGIHLPVAVLTRASFLDANHQQEANDQTPPRLTPTNLTPARNAGSDFDVLSEAERKELFAELAESFDALGLDVAVQWKVLSCFREYPEYGGSAVNSLSFMELLSKVPI
jgi:hypothetical protein